MSAGTEYYVKLDLFEGPLDLLLFIIRRHELEIIDIPVSFVLDRYLEYIAAMKELQLDVAGEYLAMAATLVYIKSRMLLPSPPPDEEAEVEIEDPRAELVRRLLEYRKYREAAASLSSLAQLGDEIFTSGFEAEPGDQDVVVDASLFDLVEIVGTLIREARARGSKDADLLADRLTVADRIQQISETVARRERLAFRELLGQSFEIFDVVITFLAILEMTRLRMIRLVQASEGDEIILMQAPRFEESSPKEHDDGQ